jgi:hypothetical protein
MNGNHSPDAVRNLAYQLWLDRGCVGGSPEDDWFRAEEILSDEHRAALQEDGATAQVTGSERRKTVEKVVDRAVEESFPASDPPAVHLKDEPPVNAGDKWKAAEKAGKPGRGNKRSGGGAIA